MADAVITPQPTILIKKADGTSERITLEEFKKRKQAKSVVSAQSVQSAESAVGDAKSDSVVSVSMVSEKSAGTETEVQTEKSQVKPLVVHKGQVRRPIPIVPTTQTVSVSKPARRAIPIIPSTSPAAEVSVTPVPTTLPQVATEQHLATTTPVTRVFEYPQSSVVMPVARTKKDDLRSLLDEDVSEINSLRDQGAVSHAPATQVNFSSSVSIPKDLEARANALILSWKKGIRDEHQFREYAMKPSRDGGLGMSEEDTQKLFSEIAGTATLVAPSTQSGVRPVSPLRPPTPRPVARMAPAPASVIQEVRTESAAPSVMGPREEILSFSIDDFRRLSRDPKTAGAMVLSKFSGWKDESYLLYLQVRDSWRQSPLFRTYIDSTIQALRTRQTIAHVLSEGGLSYPEYQALVEVHRKLEMMD